jgi:spore maturation protein CgeB
LIAQFDAYLSFTGGPILDLLQERYHARRAVAFHCSVDPAVYRPLAVRKKWDLAYLGTYSADRQGTVDRLLVDAANALPDRKFCVAGSLYPEEVRWPGNVHRIHHLPPKEHCAFYNQQRFTLNVTRQAMVKFGYSPSVRLFEAAACGVPIISDAWAGLETFLDPNREILIAKTTDEVTRILTDMDEKHRLQIGTRARSRILREHTADHRAKQLEALVGRRKRPTVKGARLAAQEVQP